MKYRITIEFEIESKERQRLSKERLMSLLGDMQAQLESIEDGSVRRVIAQTGKVNVVD